MKYRRMQAPPRFEEPRTMTGPNGESVINISGIFLWLFEMDPSDYASSRYKTQIDRWRERARGYVEAEAIKSAPRSVAEVLYDRFGGAAIERQIDEACDGPGTSGTISIQRAFGFLFEESKLS